MSKQSVRENLVKVKTALAEKYDRLAATANSRPRKARMSRHAETYRRLAKNLDVK